VNFYKVFYPQGKQLIQTILDMGSLKIDRSNTTQKGSASSYGKGTFIQGNNVHINKGKAPMESQMMLHFSYKEVLKRAPPPKPIEEETSDEDDTICERCNRILAKCFANPSQSLASMEKQRLHRPTQLPKL
jgi:hypothetical protein